MLAQRTDKVLGYLLAHVFVAADRASPDSLTVVGRSNSFGLWLDIALVVLISSGRHIAENAHIRNIGNEHGMCAEVRRLNNFPTDIAVCALCDTESVILKALAVGEIRKLVYIPTGSKPKVLEKLESSVIADDGGGKLTGFRYHIMSEVAFVDCDTNTVRIRSYLHKGVCDASVVSFFVLSC